MEHIIDKYSGSVTIDISVDSFEIVEFKFQVLTENTHLVQYIGGRGKKTPRRRLIMEMKAE